MILLDTHFVLWLVTEDRRLKRYSFLEHRRPWLVSPVVILEMRILNEVGRARMPEPGMFDALRQDPRFEIDDIPVLSLVEHALDNSWTRDPFDRLIAAHSSARRIPLCTLDDTILTHHPLIVPELRPPRRRRR